MKTFARVCMMCFALFAGKVSYGVPWNEDDVRNEDMLAPTTYENVTLTFDGQAAAEGDAVAVFREGTDGTVFCGYGEVFQSKLEFTLYAAKDTALTLKVWRTGTPDPEVLAPTSITLDGENVDTLLAPNPGSTISGLVLAVVQSFPQTYTVTYKPGTNGVGAEQTDSKTKDVSLTLKDAIFTRTGYTQTGWAESDGGTQVYGLSGTYTANAAATLYPFWTANTYTVTLDRQNGSGGTASVTATYDSTMPSITIPTRSGYTFGGYWTGTNGSGTQYYTATGASTRAWDKTTATTLYAKWTANSGSGTEPIWTIVDGVLTAVDLNGCTDVTIPDGVTRIGEGAFEDCTGLASVTIPDSVTSIGDYAFDGCSGLTSVTIPVGVTSIGKDAFHNCYGLTSVTIPNSVTSIGKAAFLNCYGLTSVMIPDGVTSIGAGAFRNCSRLRSVTIPDSVTRIGNKAFDDCDRLYNTETISGIKLVDGWVVGYTDSLLGVLNLAGIRGISGGSFYGCSVLTSVTIPEGITSIEDSSFEACTGLTSVTIPDGVTIIGSSAFYGCNGLTSVTIPDGVTDIASYAFFGCSGLTSVTIPDSVTSIGDYAFSGCSGLTSVTIPDGVTNIEDYVFYNCSGLTSVTIPDSVTSIGFKAFYGCVSLKNLMIPYGVSLIEGDTFCGCSSLTSVTIPDSVTRIEFSAFSRCDSLESVIIGNGVTNIGQYAFYNCSGLTNLTFEGNAPTVADEAFSFVGKDCTAYVKRGSTGWGVYIPGRWYISNQWNGINSMRIEYTDGGSEPALTIFNGVLKEVELRGETDVVIPNGVTNIGYRAFSGCSGLTSVTIPDGVTSIGDHAFSGCSGLTSVTIPDGVTSIGDHAFYDCSGLTSVTIPDGVTSVGYAAFSGCSGLTSVTIGNGVTSIGDYAFYDCSGLTSVTIPDSVTEIGTSAFSGCSGLMNVVIGNDVTSIGSGAFFRCSGLTSMTIPDSVTSIGDYTFYGCSGLTNVTIPDGVTSIGYMAFNDCSGLMSVTIPDSVTSIGYAAFSGCDELTSVTIPESVTNIAQMAFYYCSGLTNIFFKGNAPVTAMPLFGAVGSGCTAYVKRGSTGWGVAIPGTWNGIRIEYADGDEVAEPIWTIENGVLTAVDLNGCTDVTIPGGVTRIGYGAFQNCNGLVNVTIPDNVTYIDSDAFKNCGNLTSTMIGNGLESLSSSAFEGCTNLTEIVIGEGNVNFAMKDGVLYDWSRKTVVFILYNATSAIIEEGIETIEGHVFSDRSRLADVSIPDTVKEIGYFGWGAFPPAFMAESGMVTCDGWVMKIDIENPPFGLGNGNPPSGDLNLTRFRGIANGAFDLFIYMVDVYGLYSFENVYVQVSSDCRVGTSAFDGWTGVHIVRVDDISCAVTFDANGGTVTEIVRHVTSGTSVGTLPVPTREGFTFAGWWTEAEGGTQVTAGTVVTEDVTLYAHWTEIPPDDGTGGGATGDDTNGGDTTAGVVLPWTAKKAVTLDGAVYDADGKVAGVVQLKVAKPNAKKHNAKVSGSVTLLDGKKRTLKAAAFAVSADAPISAALTVKGLGTLSLVIGDDGFEGSVGGYIVADAKVGGKWTRTDARVYVEVTGVPAGTIEDLLPDGEPVRAKGGKWAFDKAAPIKYAKGVLSGYTDPKKPNLSALKLTYTPKTGLFKGSFKLYALQGGKLKKYTVKVTGVVVDGEGTGVAKLAKPAATWDVSVR